MALTEAAPELLAAMRKLDTVYGDTPCTDAQFKAWEQARAAIAKARGQTGD